MELKLVWIMMTNSNYPSKNTCSIYGHIYHPPPLTNKKPQILSHGLSSEFHN